MKKVVYVAPETKLTKVELENGFMKGSVFEPENGNDKGLTTEEHGFANPEAQWEGNYGDSEWD